ncbi:MAG: DUF3307 domain-containing protein [Bacteroidota bacterium]
MDFIAVLIAHWVGDYLFQTSEMANRKSQSLKWLGLHVATYGTVLLFCAVLLFSWQVALGYTLLNFIFHFITDFITSKWAARYQNNPRLFFPILGLDQLLHGIALYWTYLYTDILAI